MTKRQKVIDTINHRENETVPYYIGFTGPELQKMIEYTGDPKFNETFGNHIDWINATDHYVPVAGKPGFVVDEFGVEYDMSDKNRYIISKNVLKEPTLKDYCFPGPVEEKIRSNVDKMVNNGRDAFKMVNVGITLFERAWALRGMEDLLVDMVEEEAFVNELLDKINEYNLAVMDVALEYDGFDAFYFGDDCGQQQGMIMGPNYWRKYIKPRLAKLIEYSKSHGKYTVLHACGDQREILRDFVEIGLDVYETFQPEIYDMKKVKAEVGDKLSFLGGISTQRMLPYETPDNVKKIICETIEIMGKGGGYIVAPTHEVPGDVPPENVMAMIDIFQNQRNYKLNQE
jgi:uroporphyrinogen decarboxylase